MFELSARAERWPIRGSFGISRARLTTSYVVVAELNDGVHSGRGECEPHESEQDHSRVVVDALRALNGRIDATTTGVDLAALLPAGPARNALDCALWDLKAKQSGRRVWDLCKIAAKPSISTVFTLGLDTPEAMANEAILRGDWPQLKVKLGGDDATDVDRIRQISSARPDCRLIVDANGGWTIARLRHMLPHLVEAGVELVEQPLPPGADAALADFRSPIPLCADESCLDRSSLPQVIGKYQAINIKLDKTGGLTEALALAEAATATGLTIMVGCMVGTSLAMAPAWVVAQLASFVDLDGPLLLEHDRDPGITYADGRIIMPTAEIWG